MPLFGEAGFQLYRLVAVYIRVSQVYLDMAEASYEATGDPDAVVTGCTMSARQALNKIRVRAELANYRMEWTLEKLIVGNVVWN